MARILLWLTRIITWFAECTVWHTCSGLVSAFLSWKFKEDLHEVKVAFCSLISLGSNFSLTQWETRFKLLEKLETKSMKEMRVTGIILWVAQRIALYANWISAMDIVLINSSSIKMSSFNFYVKSKENCFLGCTNIWKTIKLVQKIMLKSKNNYTQMG